MNRIVGLPSVADHRTAASKLVGRESVVEKLSYRPQLYSVMFDLEYVTGQGRQIGQRYSASNLGKQATYTNT